MLTTLPTHESKVPLDDLKARYRKIDADHRDRNPKRKLTEKHKRILKVVGAIWLVCFVLEYVIQLNSSDFVSLIRGLIVLTVPIAIPVIGFELLGQTLNPNTKFRDAERLLLLAEIKKRVFLSFPGVEHYSATSEFPSDIYKSSLLFPKRNYDAAVARDDVQGHFKNVKYRILDIATSFRERAPDVSGKMQLTHTPIFQGYLLAADFNKNLNGITLLSTDFSEEHAGNWAKELQRFTNKNSPLQVIDLENQEFENQFIVRSTDPVEARYILSSNFMEQVVEVQNQFDGNVQMVFKDGTLLITIPFGYDLIDPLIELEDVEWTVKTLSRLMANLMHILDTLELDNLIWNTGNLQEKAS